MADTQEKVIKLLKEVYPNLKEDAIPLVYTELANLAISSKGIEDSVAFSNLVQPGLLLYDPIEGTLKEENTWDFLCFLVSLEMASLITFEIMALEAQNPEHKELFNFTSEKIMFGEKLSSIWKGNALFSDLFIKSLEKHEEEGSINEFFSTTNPEIQKLKETTSS